MRWVLRKLAAILYWLAQGREQPGETSDGAAAWREEIVAALGEHGGFRRIERHTLGPPVESDGVGWDVEQLHYMDEGGVQTMVEHRRIRRCSCGSAIAFGTSLVGSCGLCGTTLCSQEGCAAGHCERCGVLVCQRHAVRHNGHVFCSLHRHVMYWLAFWSALD